MAGYCAQNHEPTGRRWAFAFPGRMRRMTPGAEPVAWPTAPTCHIGEQHYGTDPDQWRPPRVAEELEPYQEMFRTCSYCGSIHPGDLYEYLRDVPYTPRPDYKPPADLAPGEFEAWKNDRDAAHIAWRGIDVADWKYGWPHKLYIQGIPNPVAGRTVPIYTTSGDPDGLRERYGAEPQQVTRYGSTFWQVATGSYPAPATVPAKWYNQHLADLEQDAFEALAEELRRLTGIRFDRETDGHLGIRINQW